MADKKTKRPAATTKKQEVKKKPPPKLTNEDPNRAEKLEDATLNERFSVAANRKKGIKPYKEYDKDMAREAAGIPVPQIVDLEAAPEALEVIRSDDEELAERCKGFLQVILEGGKHKDALAKHDFVWNMIVNLRHRYKGFNELYPVCKEIGEEYRKVVRADAAHERAVDGVDEPLYSNNGTFLGNKKVYSDRLLELLLKADNPDKFSDRKKVDIQGTCINIVTGFDREALKEEILEEAQGVEERD